MPRPSVVRARWRTCRSGKIRRQVEVGGGEELHASSSGRAASRREAAQEHMAEARVGGRGREEPAVALRRAVSWQKSARGGTGSSAPGLCFRVGGNERCALRVGRVEGRVLHREDRRPRWRNASKVRTITTSRPPAPAALIPLCVYYTFRQARLHRRGEPERDQIRERLRSFAPGRPPPRRRMREDLRDREIAGLHEGVFRGQTRADISHGTATLSLPSSCSMRIAVR